MGISSIDRHVPEPLIWSFLSFPAPSLNEGDTTAWFKNINKNKGIYQQDHANKFNLGEMGKSLKYT